MPGTEVITATVEDEPGVTVKGVDHYWVASAPSGTSSGELKYHDKRRNTLVYDASGGPYVITYRTGDQFNHGASTEKYDSFRENIKEGDTLTVVVSRDVNGFTRTTP